MQVNVEDRLPGVTTIIDHHAVSFAVQVLLLGNSLGDQEQMTDALSVIPFHAVNIRNMYFRNNQDVNRSLRIYILERDRRRIFIDDSRSNLLFDDLAEETAVD